MTLLIALLLAAIVVVGMGLSYLADVDFSLEERVGYGAFFGLLTYVITALLATRLFGFNGGGVFFAILLSLAISGWGWRLGRSLIAAEAADFMRRIRQPLNGPGNHTAFVPFMLAGWYTAIRILGRAYNYADGGINSGNLAIFSDWQAHSTYTASFALSGNTGFDLPTATGEALAYHNGINFFAATLMPAGANLQSALTVSSGFCAFFFPLALYLAAHRIFESRWVAGLGTAIFFMFGGLGWINFFSTDRRWDPTDPGSPVLPNLVDSGLGDALSTFPQRYTRFYDAGYWMENSVVGHLYPQRPTLIGFPVTIIAVMLIWSAYKRRSTQTFLFAGVLIGVMPFFHLFGWMTPLALGGLWAFAAQFEDRTFVRSRDLPRFGAIAALGLGGFALVTMATDIEWFYVLLAVGVLAGVAGLFAQQEGVEWRSEWLWFLVPAVVLSAPVAYFMQPPQSDPDFAYSWVIRTIQDNETDVGTGLRRLTESGGPADVGVFQTLWENALFWFKNFGFFLPLLVVAQLSPKVLPRRIALASAPLWLWFLIPTFTRLHPWPGNNTHYLIFVVLLGAFPVAALLVHIVKHYAIIGMLVPALVFTMVFSGLLDIRASAEGQVEASGLLSPADVVMADWVLANTDDDAVFVVADDNTHPMSSLTGRRIVAGFNGWIYDLGIEDWFDRTQNSAHILQGGPDTPILIDEYEVDYVVIGPRERFAKQANDDYWSQNAQVVYDFGGYRVYEVS